MGGALAYAFTLSRFKIAMNKYDKNGLYKLGMDTLSDLFGPSHGTVEAQGFFYKRLYLKYPDPDTSKAAHKVYLSICTVILGFVLVFLGMIFS